MTGPTTPTPRPRPRVGVRGRGRPVEFTPDRRTALLQAVTQGATLADAATQIGTSRPTIHRHRRTDPHFDQQLAAAQQEGARARRATRDCDIDRCGTQARYIKAGCRCPDCTAAATKARYARTEAAAEPALAHALIVPLAVCDLRVDTIVPRAG